MSATDAGTVANTAVTVVDAEGNEFDFARFNLTHIGKLQEWVKAEPLREMAAALEAVDDVETKRFIREQAWQKYSDTVVTAKLFEKALGTPAGIVYLISLLITKDGVRVNEKQLAAIIEHNGVDGIKRLLDSTTETLLKMVGAKN